ncbi:MAG: sulfotransferase [Planctomycetaceae bacterium]|nr:sulfotransferase [Planctomycetaceae bacterium]
MSALVVPPQAAPPAASPPATESSDKIHRSTQGLFCLWHGMNHRDWRALLKMGLPLPPQKRLRRWSISALSLLNSWHEFVEQQFYGRRIEQTVIEHPPIFVLGHWRSGTTLLHNLFALDPQFAYPNLYQCLFPGHFLLTEHVTTALTGWLVPKTRPMDNIPADWKMSQEDEFALLLRTRLSPYMLLAFQGQRERYGRLFALADMTPEEHALWTREFLLFVKKLTVRSPRPLVLKSPSHTYRIPLLLELFPDARFVYISRDPYAVYSSTVHLRKTTFVENCLGVPNFDGLEADVQLSYEECIRRYEATKSLIPAGHLHELRFEDLEVDPLTEMQRVYEQLKLPGWDCVAPTIRDRMPQLAEFRKNRFTMDPDTMRQVYNRLKFAFDLYGYPSRLSDRGEAVT